MFKIADVVEITNGIGKGKQGTVEVVEENDLGSRTYTVWVRGDAETSGMLSKLEKDLKLVKASKNKTSKAKKKDAESVSSYDKLVETYDVLRRNITVAELELFYDIVKNDLEDGKSLFEMMYQFPISALLRIKKDVDSGMKK